MKSCWVLKECVRENLRKKTLFNLGGTEWHSIPVVPITIPYNTIRILAYWVQSSVHLWIWLEEENYVSDMDEAFHQGWGRRIWTKWNLESWPSTATVIGRFDGKLLMQVQRLREKHWDGNEFHSLKSIHLVLIGHLRELLFPLPFSTQGVFRWG